MYQSFAVIFNGQNSRYQSFAVFFKNGHFYCEFLLRIFPQPLYKGPFILGRKIKIFEFQRYTLGSDRVDDADHEYVFRFTKKSILLGRTRLWKIFPENGKNVKSWPLVMISRLYINVVTTITLWCFEHWRPRVRYLVGANFFFEKTHFSYFFHANFQSLTIFLNNKT